MKTKTTINKDTVAIAGEEYTKTDNLSYICNYCNRNLVKISDSNGKNVAWYCNKCSIEFNPEQEQLRRTSKITTSEGPNTETLVATTPDPVSEFYHKSVEPKDTFELLQKKGIKVKDYKETDGAGRVIS